MYYNPKVGFESEDKLWHKANEINDKITHEDVDEILHEQTVPQITKPFDREVEFDTIESPSVRNNYKMDITFLPSPTFNNNYEYLLTCIYIYSRYCFICILWFDVIIMKMIHMQFG